jgi:hypothetical protein
VPGYPGELKELNEGVEADSTSGSKNKVERFGAGELEAAGEP